MHLAGCLLIALSVYPDTFVCHRTSHFCTSVTLATSTYLEPIRLLSLLHWEIESKCNNNLYSILEYHGSTRADPADLAPDDSSGFEVVFSKSCCVALRARIEYPSNSSHVVLRAIKLYWQFKEECCVNISLKRTSKPVPNVNLGRATRL
jgi:hypothetical protein